MELPIFRKRFVKQTPSTAIDHYPRRTARIRRLVDKNSLAWADHPYAERYFRSSFFSKSRIDRLALIGQQFRRANQYYDQLKKLKTQKNVSLEKATTLVNELDQIHQRIFSTEYNRRLNQLLTSFHPEENDPEYRYALKMAESREILRELTRKMAQK